MFLMRVLSSKEGSVDDELRLLMSNESCIKRKKRFLPNPQYYWA